MHSIAKETLTSDMIHMLYRQILEYIPAFMSGVLAAADKSAQLSRTANYFMSLYCFVAKYTTSGLGVNLT